MAAKIDKIKLRYFISLVNSFPQAMIFFIFIFIPLFLPKEECFLMDAKNIIAHRGAWKDFGFAQNSVAAFLKAQELPIGGIEFDLQYTKNGKVIVFHDDAFKGNYITQKRYIQLKGYEYFGKEKFLTFKRLLKYWEGEKTLWIELKPSNLNGIQKKEFVKKTLAILGHLKNNIHFISFDFTLLKLIRKYSAFPCAYLGDDLPTEKIFKNEIYGIDAEYIRYTKEENLIQEIKQLDMTSNAWTVNNRGEAEILFKKGVDFVTTDEILRLIT